MDRSASKPFPDDSHSISMEPPSGRRSGRRNGTAPARVSAKVEVEGGGIHVERRFTHEGVHPFDEVTWETRTAAIGNEKGVTVFEQKDCEIPTFWSQMATNVVVSKYFRGKLGTPGRETSVKQMISRVSDTIGKWGREGGYFATETDASAFQDELTHLLLHQKMSFNSPVWFNLGVATSKPQISACQPYDARVATPKGLIPIGELVERNAVGAEVFDRTGVTRVVATKANGRKEVFRLTIGSGVSVDATADHVILVADDRKGSRTSWKRVSEVRSGDRLVLDASRTVMRRAEASVMELAGLGAPREDAGRGRRFQQQGDLDSWIEAAATEPSAIAAAEAALAGWLQGDGYVGVPTGCTSLVVELQPADSEELAEVERLVDIVFPGVHRDITRSHPSLDRGCYRLRLSGEVLVPFVNKWELTTRGAEMRVPSRLWSSSTEEIAAYVRSLFQADGYVSLQAVTAARRWPRATVGLGSVAYQLAADVQQLLLSLGIHSAVRSEPSHRGRQPFHTVTVGTRPDRLLFAELVGFPCARKASLLRASLEIGVDHTPRQPIRFPRVVSIEARGVMDVYDIQTESGNYLSNHIVVHNCFINSVEDTMESILTLAKTEGMLFKYGSGTGTNLSTIRSATESLAGGGTASGPVSFMKGFDAFAGVIKSGGTTRRAAKMVILNADHPDVEEFITCKVSEERKAWALIEAGYDSAFTGEAYSSVFFQNSNNSVRVTDEFMRAVQDDRDWHLRAVTDSNRILKTVKARELMRLIAESAWQCGDPGMQYDTTINDWHTSAATGRINASNPCSEYMFLDDTSCNLASINLTRFLNDDGSIDIEAYKHAIHITITAQEILVSNASYPTEKIAKNSEEFRPLGLGYANLGALLMARGVPYDSPQGRDLAACLTSILTGEAYAQSARIAREIGPFSGYALNRQPMLRVVGKHREASYNIPTDNIEADLVAAARHAWDEAHELGARHGYRNSQATVLAPTGTISFMLDCDTTGVEPDIALVKYKKLVGGGMLKMVNGTVPAALRRLGYGETAIADIIAFIDGNDTIEGAPTLRDEDVAVFDCAFTPQNGKRSITWQGHLRMMAAVQPFISGAISKTVNMPNEATVEDIERAYTDGWKLGLKAVAIYRDGSKRSQPLATSIDKTTGHRAQVVERPLRKRLPAERTAITHKFEVGGHEGYITVGLYEDGTPGEIFLRMAKEGSTVSGLMDSFATAVSLALQYGVPLPALVDKFSHTRFDPQGFTRNPEIPIAKSVMDYIFRWLASKFLPQEERDRLGIIRREPDGSVTEPVSAADAEIEAMAPVTVAPARKPVTAIPTTSAGAFINQEDAPTCSDCGSLMVRNGACYKCHNCGATSGCS